MSQPTYVEMSLSTIGGDMKRLLLTGASLLALMAADPANASTVILYSGPAITLFTAPAAGAYEIVAYGAEGGGASPGKGAKVSGVFSLTDGEVLQIAVGGAGASSVYGSGGGGGSFVIGPGNRPLVIAGGGGGSAAMTNDDMAGFGGQTTTYGATETAQPSREAEGAATVTAAVAEGRLRAAAGVVVLPGRALDTVRMEVVQEAFSLSVAARVSAAAAVDLGAAGAAAVIRSLETAQHTPLAGVVGAAAIAAAARAHRRAIMDSMEPAAAVAVPSAAARTLYSLRTIGPETARSRSQR
jgi:hypothetical protein